jgi:hypothetical protein
MLMDNSRRVYPGRGMWHRIEKRGHASEIQIGIAGNDARALRQILPFDRQNQRACLGSF